MRLDLNVYCKNISPDLVPKIVKRLNDFDMFVEVHPDFTLNQEKDTGFLPFKFRFKNPPIDKLRDKELISGFEIYIDDFDLQKTKDEIKPKLSFIRKLFYKKNTEPEFAPQHIEYKLQECKKVVTFIWHIGDTFEVRFATMTSAILTELTNGLCYYPADNIWYDNNNIVEQTYKEVIDYEKAIKEKDFQIHEFDKW